MGYRDALLSKATALESHEVEVLREWLNALESDCAMFGPTNEDDARMALIRARIEREANRPSPSPNPRRA